MSVRAGSYCNSRTEPSPLPRSSQSSTSAIQIGLGILEFQAVTFVYNVKINPSFFQKALGVVVGDSHDFKHAVMHRKSGAWLELEGVFDSVTDFHPRTGDWQSEYVDRGLGVNPGVTRIKQLFV